MRIVAPQVVSGDVVSKTYVDEALVALENGITPGTLLPPYPGVPSTLAYDPELGLYWEPLGSVPAPVGPFGFSSDFGDF